MRDLVDRSQVEPTHDRRRSCVALGSGRLGQRLIGDLAHHVGTEPPHVAVDEEEPRGDELVEERSIELLLHRIGEALEREHGAGRAQHSGVVDHRPEFGRQHVEPGGDEAPERPGQAVGRRVVTSDLGELGEKQRVTARALVELVGQLRRQLGADHLGEELVGVGIGERLEGHPHHERMVEVGRRPIDRGLVTLSGDDEHRPFDHRSGEPGEELEQQAIGPLHVVEPDDHRLPHRSTHHALDDELEEDLARLRWRHPVEF